ncbi:fimbria/pilus outer membrane usher protein [Klebsiella oxytoca]|uniref:fimbria/pilus outer membrane usher protein n=1 Tax=Klebsiella oxytoca TaxID=571 RepID=UPI001CCBC575|nr:fimbria/pilus outer membrane usher protein [Klebsiella oxytoca]EIZ1084160.1 fimbrial biogenesis outer membrane usher protein [Klebsiella oxytoca]ELK0735800.1 fimbrial biogenesis outer membrane usher protein [Klebsiella oxytoca]ELW9511640.1 fimbrial biogenesis outer membrane usher protein [Klebsiella oxytoca]MBS6497233.1 fimbrial biogenesis outer membrane usher protein [Klebsiella oxytoca]MBZ7713384.1 fimbrial biogenesis outer membrane usher protein [Klebsiella oxytoca]
MYLPTRFILRPLAGVVALLAMPLYAQDIVEFDTIFMSRGSQQTLDVSRYEQNQAAPGTYRAEVYINGLLRGMKDVTVRITPPKRDSEICLKVQVLREFDIDIEKLSPAAQALLAKSEANDCLALQELIPQATVQLDSGEQRLDLEIPALYLTRNPRGYVNPAMWDHGITAGLLSYSANYYRTAGHGQTTDSAYAGLNGGFNIGGWLFRHNGSLTWQDDLGGRYQTLNTYVERDIPQIQGRLTLGETNTTGEMFDTLAFRGVQIANQEQMLPDSQRGYAPLVRGTARTNARVQIRQQGRLLYETTVPPGPFEINDLYPTGYGGDLEVQIQEEDGSIQTQTVPFASTSNLLRPGTQHYSATLGKLNNQWIDSDPWLGEFTYRRGFNNLLTGYAGLQGNENYQASQIGGAVGTPIGSFSMDVTHAKTSLEKPVSGHGRTMNGQSYQLKYSKFIPQSGSNISVAAYRFSTDGYLDYMTAMRLREAQRADVRDITVRRAKSRLGITASQNLAENWGTFWVSAYQQNYWNSDESDRQYQLGYSNRFGNVSYSLSASRNRNGQGDFENNFALNMSIPLGSRSPFSSLSVNLNHDPGGVVREQMTLSGSALEDKSLSYSLSGANANKGGKTSVSSSATLRTPYTTLQAFGGSGKNYHNYSLGMSGAAVLHRGGVTLSPYSGETQALVEAQGATGAVVSGYPGIKVDSRGYALVPYLNAYQLNEISIDPKGIPEDIELDHTSQKVSPYRGAVVKLSFGTTQGRPVFIKLNGTKEVPFGAYVLDQQDNMVGVVGQGKLIFARLGADTGQLTISWGEEAETRCRLNYQLPPAGKTAENVTITAACN